MLLKLTYDTLQYDDGQLTSNIVTLPNVICIAKDGDNTTFYLIIHACGGPMIDKLVISTRDIHQILRMEKPHNDIDRAIDRMLNEQFPYHYYISTEKGELLKPYISESVSLYHFKII